MYWTFTVSPGFRPRRFPVAAGPLCSRPSPLIDTTVHRTRDQRASWAEPPRWQRWRWYSAPLFCVFYELSHFPGCTSPTGAPAGSCCACPSSACRCPPCGRTCSTTTPRPGPPAPIFHIEHLWANHPGRVTDEITDPVVFRTLRNQLGDLGLLGAVRIRASTICLRRTRSPVRTAQHSARRPRTRLRSAQSHPAHLHQKAPTGQASEASPKTLLEPAPAWHEPQQSTAVTATVFSGV
jgi:hypothetical protein